MPANATEALVLDIGVIAVLAGATLTDVVQAELKDERCDAVGVAPESSSEGLVRSTGGLCILRFFTGNLTSICVH